jgi:hypothetical protein
MRKVLAEPVLQMSLFAETPAEVEDQGRRYVLSKNERFEGRGAQVECYCRKKTLTCSWKPLTAPLHC